MYKSVRDAVPLPASGGLCKNNRIIFTPWPGRKVTACCIIFRHSLLDARCSRTREHASQHLPSRHTRPGSRARARSASSLIPCAAATLLAGRMHVTFIMDRMLSSVPYCESLAASKSRRNTSSSACMPSTRVSAETPLSSMIVLYVATASANSVSASLWALATDTWIGSFLSDSCMRGPRGGVGRASGCSRAPIDDQRSTGTRKDCES